MKILRRIKQFERDPLALLKDAKFRLVFREYREADVQYKDSSFQ